MMGGRGSIVIGAAGRQIGFGILERPGEDGHSWGDGCRVSVQSTGGEVWIPCADEPQDIATQRFTMTQGRKVSAPGVTTRKRHHEGKWHPFSRFHAFSTGWQAPPGWFPWHCPTRIGLSIGCQPIHRSSLPVAYAMNADDATHVDWLEHAALSDLGLRRGNNQDALAVALAGSHPLWMKQGHLFAVADGMGAHAAGELASELAADLVPLSYQKRRDQSPPDALRAAITETNQQIHARGQSSSDFKGMGTTCTVMLLLPQGAVLGHVGDSRAYRLRADRFEQLTFDHSLVWEMRAAGQIPAGEKAPDYIPSNVITRSLGPNPSVEVDLEGPFPLKVGDTFLLCSDGLSGPVSDEEIGTIANCLPPRIAAQALVDLANLRGGPDNITTVIVRVTGTPPVSDGRDVEEEESGRAARPVHPALWTAIGVCCLAAVGLVAMGHTISAMASGIGAAVAAVLALVQRYGPGGSDEEIDGRRHGQGPYTEFDCTPTRAFFDGIAQTCRELQEAAEGENWAIEWEPLLKISREAAAAADGEDFRTAVARTAQAISYLMAQARQSGGNAAG